MTIIRTDQPEKLEAQLEKALKELYRLEDLNDYKNNTIGKTINELQRIKFRRG